MAKDLTEEVENEYIKGEMAEGLIIKYRKNGKVCLKMVRG